MAENVKTGSHREKKLSAAFVRTVSRPGKYGDGHGLMLVVEKSGAKRWVQRVTINGRRVDLGHGSASLVSLSEARERAYAARKQARDGEDPLADKRRNSEVQDFETVARKVHELKLPTWKNPKHADQWINTLDTYVFPTLGKRRVSDISVADVLAVLKPIWTSKHETATRVRQRMGDVFKWSIAQGWRTDNPIVSVNEILPKVSKAKVQQRKSLDYDRIGEFLEKLQGSQANPLTKLALELLILTATRSSEVRQAEWTEIDFAKAEWTIPADRMKAATEHRIPLTARMLAILEEAKLKSGNRRLIFPGPTGEKSLSENTFQKLVRDMGYDIHVHGFRSSFRTWAQDHTEYAREVVEAALAHQEGNKVVAAYARSDLFDKRRNLMEDWEKWCKI